MVEKTWLNGERNGDVLANRAFFFGENPFTTMYVCRGRVAFLSDHFERLRLSQQWISEGDDWSGLKNQISSSLKQNLPTDGEWKARVTIFRDQNLSWNHFLALSETPPVPGSLKVCWARSLRGVPSLPHYIKMGSYFEADAEKKLAAKKGFEDVVFLNHRHQVMEASTSNVFFKMGDKVITPLAQNGMLSGITRNKLISLMNENGIICDEKLIEARETDSAEEMWLTGAVSGLKRVGRFNDRELKNQGGLFDEISQMYIEFRDASLEEI